MDFKDLPRGVQGTRTDLTYAPQATWASQHALSNSDQLSFSDDKVYLGTTMSGSKISVGGDRHLLTIAGTRSGKGTSAIIPNLLLYTGSVFVIDPKGENATITAERRGHGRGIKNGGLNQEVFVIDPFKVADVPDEYRAGYDPIKYLKAESDDFIDDCDNIADALVVAPADKLNDFWNSSARNVLRGFIAWIADGPGIEDRSLNELRRLINLPSQKKVPENIVEEIETFESVLYDMLLADHVGEGIPTETASALLSMDDRERANVMATVRQQISFISSPQIGKMITHDRQIPDLENWKLDGMTIYLCLPAGRMHRHNRFMRLFINQLFNAIEQKKQEPRTRALMILDEIHVLGYMNSIEMSTALLAGFGVRIWSIWQDLSQMKDLYSKRWETFMGNAGVVQWFGLNDLTSLEYVSKRLGNTSVMRISKNEISSHQAASGFDGKSRSIEQMPLLTPDEVAKFFARQTSNQLVIYPGSDPFFLKRTPYYEVMQSYLVNK